MKRDIEKHVSQKLKISKSTVSKVLRHRSGVSSQTRQLILNELDQLDYHLYSECAIYTILPDVPSYFWKEMGKGLMAGAQSEAAPVKYNVYTRVNDDKVVLSYLNEAEYLNAHVIIIAASITPEIHQRLSDLADGRLIILLSEHHEYHEIKNYLFVGADSFADGYSMGKYYLSHHSARRLIFLSFSKTRGNVQARLEGFRQAIKEEAPRFLVEALQIELQREFLENYKMLPARIASVLADYVKDDVTFCIYVPQGLSQLPLAIGKAKLAGRVVCLGHDCFTPFEGFDAVCNQDIFAQGDAAMQAAVGYVANHRYPAKREIYIPSNIN